MHTHFHNPSSQTVKSINPDEKKRILHIIWSDGHTSHFHFVWLRHHALCPHGIPNDTSVKVSLLPDDPSALQITQVRLSDSSLFIHWSDMTQVTEHDLESLKQSDYSQFSRLNKKAPVTLWDKHNSGAIPCFHFSTLQDETTLFDLLLGIRDYGVVKIKHVPTKPDTIARIAQLLGPIHVNNYGEVFDVKTDTRTNLGSNTGVHLGPHTDESYRHAPPGVSLFHCLQDSTEGGDSMLVDGFHAATKLRETDPKSFQTLSQVRVFFQRHAPGEENMQSHARVIVTDTDGEIDGIRFTDRTIPPQDIPENLIEPVYQGIRKFWNLVNDTEMIHQYHMTSGDLHIFDNHRVLHGRTAFQIKNNTTRHLQQCSVNRDEFHNTLRLLSAKLGRQDHTLTMSGGANG
ncbi:MAG: DUF971 domain-containing protein [Gammaproteobacteria bacterium]|nr:DUF971 domain-containing protein [Gammaproteobacteria bacterium]